MCGIVGYVGNRPVQDLLLQGLQRLEYRGYDSAGVSVLSPTARSRRSARSATSRTSTRPSPSAPTTTAPSPPRPRRSRARPASATPAGPRTAGSPRPTRTRTPTTPTTSTSWSTASSRTSCRSSSACATSGAEFTSETDAEVIAHLIAHHMATGDLVEAVRRTYNELEGHFSFVAMHRSDPDDARRRAPRVPAGHRRRRRRELPGLRRLRVPLRDPPRPVDRERRARRHPPRRDDRHDARGRGDRARGHRARLGPGDGREGGLRDLHAQGDPRAGRGRRRDDRRPDALGHRRGLLPRVRRGRSCATPSAS